MSYNGMGVLLFMETLSLIGLYAGLLLFIYIAGMRVEPYKPAWRLMERGLLGLGLLLGWNLLAAPMDLAIGVNPVTALVAGALGVPGLGLLLVLKVMG